MTGTPRFLKKSCVVLNISVTGIYECIYIYIQQQQQQHSLLSQASWGRLEMKPKRDEKQGDT
jgi:hypothetical protein